MNREQWNTLRKWIEEEGVKYQTASKGWEKAGDVRQAAFFLGASSSLGKALEKMDELEAQNVLPFPTPPMAS